MWASQQAWKVSSCTRPRRPRGRARGPCRGRPVRTEIILTVGPHFQSRGGLQPESAPPLIVRRASAPLTRAVRHLLSFRRQRCPEGGASGARRRLWGLAAVREARTLNRAPAPWRDDCSGQGPRGRAQVVVSAFGRFAVRTPADPRAASPAQWVPSSPRDTRDRARWLACSAVGSPVQSEGPPTWLRQPPRSVFVDSSPRGRPVGLFQ